MAAPPLASSSVTVSLRRDWLPALLQALRPAAYVGQRSATRLATEGHSSIPVSPPRFVSLLIGTAGTPLTGERDAAPSATDDGDAGVHRRQPGSCEHHLSRLRLRLLPPLLGTQGTRFFVLRGLPVAKTSSLASNS